MEGTVYAVERGSHGVGVRHIGFDQHRAKGKVRARAGREVVQHAHGVAATHQRVAQMRADKTGAAGDEVVRH